MTVGVVHLVWKPLGLEPFQRFVDSYRAHPSGHPHELVILYNGFDSQDSLESYESQVEGLPHQTLRLTQPRRDLAAYYEAVQSTRYDWYCLLNSYSMLLADGWLEILARASMQAGVGMAGATGSWDSFATHRALMSLHSTEEDRRLATQRYPPFPNPHLRTTGLMVHRDRWLAYEPFRDVIHKEDAHQAESGFRGFSQTLLKQGLALLLVGRDGRAWTHEAWDQSGTFRGGGQENLLISDNQTETYRNSPPDEQARVREVTWGCWTGMRDQETWSPMELVRQLDNLVPRSHPERFLPLHWADSESDERLTAALEEAVAWWRQMHLPAQRERQRDLTSGARGIIRKDLPHQCFVWLTQEAVTSRLSGVDETWQVAWGDPFPSLLCHQGDQVHRHHGKPLAFELSDAALRLRDRQLHRLWKTMRPPWSAKDGGAPDPNRRQLAQSLLASFPDRAQSALVMAGACEHEQQWEEAATWYSRSLELDGGYADAHLGLARCLLALCQPAEARERIDHALRITPFDPRAWKLKWQARPRR